MHVDISKEVVKEWLEEVMDPEIPVLSIVDMGIVSSIEIIDTKVSLTITPTFVGCPALDAIKSEIVEKLESKGVTSVEIMVSFLHPWSSDKITDKGKLALKKFGIGPPPANLLIGDLEILDHTPCPKCNSTDTALKSAFGSTLCRTIHYCHHCKESFEQFKSI